MEQKGRSWHREETMPVNFSVRGWLGVIWAEKGVNHLKVCWDREKKRIFAAELKCRYINLYQGGNDDTT